MAGGMVGLIDQKSFRARGDSVGLNTDTFDHDLNENWSQPVDENFRIRFVLQELGEWSKAITPRLRFSTGGAYTEITSSTAVKLVATTQYDHDAETTQLLDGTGTFITGRGHSGATQDVSGVNMLQSRPTEYEWCLQLDSAQISDNDTIDFRVYHGDAPLDAYTSTPRATADADGAIKLSPTGFVNEQAFGSPNVLADVILQPTGFVNQQAFGEPSLSTTLKATGFANEQAFGEPSVSLALGAAGFENQQAFGEPALSLAIFATGFANVQAFGSPEIAVTAATIQPTGFVNTQEFGEPALSIVLSATGFENQQEFGEPAIAATLQATGFVNEQAFGTPAISLVLNATGFENQQAFGSPAIAQQAIIQPTGFVNVQAFGAPTLIADVILAATGFENEQAFGEPSLLFDAVFADEFNTLSLDTALDGSENWGWKFVGGWVGNALDDNGDVAWKSWAEQDPQGTGDTPASMGVVLHEATGQGTVKLYARENPEPDNFFGYPYLGGMLTNALSHQQTYGRFEVRARFKATKGQHWSIWMVTNVYLGDGAWPEIDLVEIVNTSGSTNRLFMNSHGSMRTEKVMHNDTVAPSDIPAHVPMADEEEWQDFHTYIFDWRPATMEWFIDGIKRMSCENFLHTPMYLMITPEVGSDHGNSWPGEPDETTVWPMEAEIDYVRIFQFAELTFSATGFANEQSFGEPAVALTLSADGFANEQAFGEPAVSLVLSATGFENQQAFGAHGIAEAGSIKATGFVNEQAFGLPTLSHIFTAAGFENAQAFGEPAIRFTLSAAGFANTQAFGLPSVIAAAVLQATSFINEQAFGTPLIVADITLQPTGFVNVQVFGTALFEEIDDDEPLPLPPPVTIGVTTAIRTNMLVPFTFGLTDRETGEVWFVIARTVDERLVLTQKQQFRGHVTPHIFPANAGMVISTSKTRIFMRGGRLGFETAPRGVVGPRAMPFERQGMRSQPYELLRSGDRLVYDLEPTF